MDKIVEIKFGSHLYQTTTAESDLDLKGIYIPSAKEICLGTFKKTLNIARPKKDKERNNKDDIDIEIFSLDRFLELLCQGQTVALDMLFATAENYTYVTEEGTKIIDEIYKNRFKLLTRNINAFVGYARQQASRYGIKGSRMDALKQIVQTLELLPIHDKLVHHLDVLNSLVDYNKNLISLEGKPLIDWVMLPGADRKTLVQHIQVCGRKFPLMTTVKLAKDVFSKILNNYGDRANKAHLSGGKDYKALSHAVRVGTEALELLRTGHITFPRPDRELLVKIKLGQVDYDIIAEMIEQNLIDLNEAQEKSELIDTADKDWVDNFVFNVYKKKVVNE